MKKIKIIIGWILLFMIVPLLVGTILSPFHLFGYAFTIILMLEMMLGMLCGIIYFFAFLICKYLIGNWE